MLVVGVLRPTPPVTYLGLKQLLGSRNNRLAFVDVREILLEFVAVCVAGSAA
jgi:hypothetical protein